MVHILIKFGFKSSIFVEVTFDISNSVIDVTCLSPRAHVGNCNCRFQLISSILRASKLCMFKICGNCYFEGLLHYLFLRYLVLVVFGHHYLTF